MPRGFLVRISTRTNKGKREHKHEYGMDEENRSEMVDVYFLPERLAPAMQYIVVTDAVLYMCAIVFVYHTTRTLETLLERCWPNQQQDEVSWQIIHSRSFGLT